MRRSLVIGAGVLMGALGTVGLIFGAGAFDPSPCRGTVSPPAEAPSHHDPGLEDRFPRQVDGHDLAIQSFCANVADPGGINMTDEFLDEIGIERDDVTYAVNNPSIGSGLSLSVSAFRYRSASEDDIRIAMLRALDRTGEEPREETRADENVHWIRFESVCYVEGDTLYILSGPDGEVDEVLAALP
jgi:hypothetical protein